MLFSDFSFLFSAFSFSISLLMLARFATQAQELADVAGVWNNVGLSTPSRLEYQFDGQGRLTWIAGFEYFDTWTDTLVVDADGHFSGPISGTFDLAGPGLIRATVPGESVEFAINSRADFMVSAKASADGDQQDLELLLKAPSSLAVGDLTGSWRGFSLSILSGVEQIISQTVVVGLEPRGVFEARMGSLTVAADGSISGNMGGPFTGTASVGANGAVMVHIDAESPDPAMELGLVVNAGKDILAAQMAGGDDERELILFVKSPATTTSPELKGLWRASDIRVPNELTLLTNSSGAGFAVREARDFGYSREVVNVGHDGDVLAPADSMVGQATLGAGGLLRIAGTNAHGESFVKDLWANAGKDVLLSIENQEQQELTVVVKAASGGAADAVTAQPFWWRDEGCFDLFWASDTNRVLQWSRNLVDWETVEGSVGEGQWRVCPTIETNGYYRVGF